MENEEKLSKNNVQKSKKKPLFYFLSVFVWAIIAALFIYGGCGIIDKRSGYTFLPSHTAVVTSDSMSVVNEENYSYLDKDVEHINKGDIIRAKEYKTFEDVKENDVIIYVGDDNSLVCHRVVKTYVEDDTQFVVTRGDKNAINDSPIKYESVRGKVTKNLKGFGKVVMFFQSPYGFFAVCGSAFFIFLGLLIAEIGKKKPEQESKQNKNGNIDKADVTKAASFLLLIASISCTFGGLAKAYALSTQSATDVEFTIEAIPTTNLTYYLNTKSTSWTNQSGYSFTDVSSTMDTTYETTKTKEYKLDGISLDADDEIRVRDSSGTWYTCSYEHNSEYEVTKVGDNYKILMTSTSYTFYLKFYSDKGPSLYVTAQNDSFSFVPNANWASSSAKFYLYVFGNGMSPRWESLMKVNDAYVTTLPTGYTKMLIGRFSGNIPSIESCSFDKDGSGGYLWNQTGDIDIKHNIHKSKLTLPADVWDYTPTDSNWSFK